MCTSKRRYGSAKEANCVARWVAAWRKVRSYHCPLCDGWHLTKKMRPP